MVNFEEFDLASIAPPIALAVLPLSIVRLLAIVRLLMIVPPLVIVWPLEICSLGEEIVPLGIELILALVDVPELREDAVAIHILVLAIVIRILELGAQVLFARIEFRALAVDITKPIVDTIVIETTVIGGPEIVACWCSARPGWIGMSHRNGSE